MENNNNKRRKLSRIIYWVLGVFIGLFLIFNFAFSYFVNTKVPNLLANNNSGYVITYENLDVSVLSRNIRLNKIKITPKDSVSEIKSGIYATIDRIDISGIGLLKLATSNKIKVGDLKITKPILNIYPIVKDSTKVKKEFDKIILLDELDIENGSVFMYKDQQEKPFLKVYNFNFNIEDLEYSKLTASNKLPFNFTDYKFKLDSLSYTANKFYTMLTKKMYIDNKTIDIDKFKLLPNYGRPQFLKELPLENDMFTVLIDKLKLNNLDWGFKDQDLYLNATDLTFSHVNANIYRNKALPDDTSIKPLYSKLLRELNFYLNIKEVKFKDSNIVYDEEFNINDGYGSVEFSNFNATIQNVASGYKQSKLPKVKIDVQSKFYKVADLNVNWEFDVLDKTDAFLINGKLSGLPAEKVDKFIRPTFNVAAEGTFKTLFFNYSGNSVKAAGDFAIDYDDLKITVLKQNGKEKNKIISAVGNLLVKSTTDNKHKAAKVEFERLQDKGFFNLLWKTTAEGLKQTLLII